MVFFVAAGVLLIALAGVILLAFSKKSSFKTRVAALVALAVMMLTVIASVLMVLTFPGKAVALDPDAVGPPDFPYEIVQPEKENNVLLVFLIFLLVMFVLAAALLFRERRRNKTGNARR